MKGHKIERLFVLLTAASAAAAARWHLATKISSFGKLLHYPQLVSADKVDLRLKGLLLLASSAWKIGLLLSLTLLQRSCRKPGKVEEGLE